MYGGATEHPHMIFTKLFQVVPKFLMLWAINKFVPFLLSERFFFAFFIVKDFFFQKIY